MNHYHPSGNLCGDVEPLVLAFGWRVLSDLHLVPLQPVRHRWILDVVVIRQHRLDLIQQCQHFRQFPLCNYKQRSCSKQLRPGAATWRTQPNITSSDVWPVMPPDSVPLVPLSENMTSSEKLQVHNVLKVAQWVEHLMSGHRVFNTLSKMSMQNTAAVHSNDIRFNRIHQVAPTIQKRATITLGRVPSCLV